MTRNERQGRGSDKNIEKMKSMEKMKNKKKLLEDASSSTLVLLSREIGAKNGTYTW